MRKNNSRIENFYRGKVAVISGGASGIGGALCDTLSGAGAFAAVLDIDGEAAEKKAASIRDRGHSAEAFACDVSDERQCADCAARIISGYGGIDFLFNNAGITLRSSFAETSMAVYRKIFDVNFFGALNLAKPALSSIVSRKGSIVVTSSIAGVSPLYGRTGYSASKHALHGFFESLRSELAADGVHVMMICPGFTETGLQSRALGGDGKITGRPQSRTGKQDSPERVAMKICRALVKGKRKLILTPVGNATFLLSRLAPALYDRIMISKLSGELDRS